ncbi:F-actin-capping protein subunit beta [Cladochytrium replicatum]|nr:F-actin-capping protein subunit beta [Cladochytrium replicatum]
MENEQQLDCALDLMRRLPPRKVEENLNALMGLVPHLTEDLLSAIDQPLKLVVCEQTGREFLLCDYNRYAESDGTYADSWRSPWSNEYQPPVQDGASPSPRLRKLEASANDAFDTYRELYYEGGVSSVYMWDLDDGFACVILIKKTSPDGVGMWDSIHVVEVKDKGRVAKYKLTSTIMLYVEKSGKSVAGSLTRQQEQDMPLDDYGMHVANIGRMVEDMEIKMRNLIQEIYFGKTRDIANDLRSVEDVTKGKGPLDELRSELASVVGRKR